MKNPGLWLQIRMETSESIPEVILEGERITLIQALELVVNSEGSEGRLDDVRLRLRHYEPAEERGTQFGGASEIYKESKIGAPRYSLK